MEGESGQTSPAIKAAQTDRTLDMDYGRTVRLVLYLMLV